MHVHSGHMCAHPGSIKDSVCMSASQLQALFSTLLIIAALNETVHCTCRLLTHVCTCMYSPSCICFTADTELSHSFGLLMHWSTDLQEKLLAFRVTDQSLSIPDIVSRISKILAAVSCSTDPVCKNIHL